MPRLAGLTGLYGDQDQAAAGYIDEGALQAYEQSLPYKDAHSQPGDSSGQVWPAGYGLGYKGQGTYSENPSGQLAEYPDFAGSGYVAYMDPDAALDRTPSSHAGMYPRPQMQDMTTLDPDKADVIGIQMRTLHGPDQGGVQAYTDGAGGHEEPTNWTVDRYKSPDDVAMGRLDLDTIRTMGGSSGGGHLGTADVMHGYGKLNTHDEFQHGHSIRYVQHDTLHFDHTLTAGGEGVWLGRHPLGTATSFDGPDSPYGMSGDNKTGMMRAEVRGYPTEYTAAANPTVLPIAPGPQNDVWASAQGGF